MFLKAAEGLSGVQPGAESASIFHHRLLPRGWRRSARTDVFLQAERIMRYGRDTWAALRSKNNSRGRLANAE